MKVKYCKVLAGNEFCITSEWLTHRGDFLGYKVLDIECCKLFKKYYHQWYGYLKLNNSLNLSFIRNETSISEIKYRLYCGSKIKLECVGVKYLYKEEIVYTKECREEIEKLLDK